MTIPPTIRTTAWRRRAALGGFVGLATFALLALLLSPSTPAEPAVATLAVQPNAAKVASEQVKSLLNDETLADVARAALPSHNAADQSALATQLETAATVDLMPPDAFGERRVRITIASDIRPGVDVANKLSQRLVTQFERSIEKSNRRAVEIATKKRATAEAQLAAAHSALDVLTAQARDADLEASVVPAAPPPPPKLKPNPQWIALDEQITRDQAALTELLKQFGEKYPAVIEQRAKIASLELDLGTTPKLSDENPGPVLALEEAPDTSLAEKAIERRQALNTAIDAQRDAIRVADENLTVAREELNAATRNAASSGSAIRVIASAQTPARSGLPTWLALGLSLCGAASVATFAGRVGIHAPVMFRDEDDVAETLGSPVLALVTSDSPVEPAPPLVTTTGKRLALVATGVLVMLIVATIYSATSGRSLFGPF